MLLLTYVADYIFIFCTFAHNHTLINVNARRNKESASVLRVEKSVGGADTCFVNNNRASFTGLDVALLGCIAVKELIHDAVAVGVGEEFGTVADKTS